MKLRLPVLQDTCLVTHLNSRSNPLTPHPNLSVAVPFRTNSTERSLPVRQQETSVNLSNEGVYFGNVFNPALADSPKSTYAAHPPMISVVPAS